MVSCAEGHILVVDDQDNWRLALRTLLEGEGYLVSEASSFEEAKGKLAECHFDLVVLDIRLVDRDEHNVQGLEILQHITATCPTTRVTVITGYPDSIKGKIEADARILKVPEGSTFDSEGFKKTVQELVKASVV